MRRVVLLVTAAWCTFDQVTKWWVLDHVKGTGVIEVGPFLTIIADWNAGVGSELFPDFGWAFWVLALFAFGLAVVLLARVGQNPSMLVLIALGLIFGGAFGNFIDRLRYDAVLRFLDFQIASRHWPVFNVADVGIVCGIVLIIFDAITRQRD